MNKRPIWIVAAVLALAIAVGCYFQFFRAKPQRWMELKVESERFVLNISEAGTVQPENKITLNPPISGRIDKILVEEGAKVKRGQILAWMSSSDRAALMDSAQSQGGKGDAADMLEEYKPTPIISPTNGVIIARSVVEGQTVTNATGLFDLSDRLIVMADVDETDLAKIRVGQEASIKVDSFPDLYVPAKVLKIAHQSITKNSINVYEVQLEPDNLPREFRAGLTATVYFMLQDSDNVPVLPAWVAEGRENVTTKLRLKGGDDDHPVLKDVKLGSTNGYRVAILDGLKAGDVIVVKEQKVVADTKAANPFGGPSRPPSKSGKH